MWLVRLSLTLGRTPTELAATLSAADLAYYQALVEIDGPWWGEREAAMLRQLCSIQAAAGGVAIPPEQFAIEWSIGPPEPAEPLLASAEGIEVFAARYGATVERIP